MNPKRDCLHERWAPTPPDQGRSNKAAQGNLVNERNVYSMIIFGIVIENIVPLSISELTSIEP
jgi:hypothetical protein